jgi:hypothetical protein
MRDSKSFILRQKIAVYRTPRDGIVGASTISRKGAPASISGENKRFKLHR